MYQFKGINDDNPIVFQEFSDLMVKIMLVVLLVMLLKMLKDVITTVLLVQIQKWLVVL